MIYENENFEVSSTNFNNESNKYVVINKHTGIVELSSTILLEVLEFAKIANERLKKFWETEENSIKQNMEKNNRVFTFNPPKSIN